MTVDQANALAWAARSVATWLRVYASSELTMSEGLKPSAISEAVALICRNLADRVEREAQEPHVKLIDAEQVVIATARTGHPALISEAVRILDEAQHAANQVRRGKAIRRLSDP